MQLFCMAVSGLEGLLRQGAVKGREDSWAAPRMSSGMVCEREMMDLVRWPRKSDRLGKACAAAGDCRYRMHESMDHPSMWEMSSKWWTWSCLIGRVADGRGLPTPFEVRISK